jgi:hypothetical protein
VSKQFIANSCISKFFVFVWLCFISLDTYCQNLEKIGKKDMLTISGGLNYNSIYYNASGIPNRREPYTWFLNGNLTANFLDIALPFNFSYSNNQSQFTQPFNMTSINPTYKWAKAHIGFSSMNFSPYTLSGHIFMGAGIELTPNKWKISAMYGRLKKAVRYDENEINIADFSYKRMGQGLKVAYDHNGYMIGITYFSAKDDINSVPYIPLNTELSPQENTVIGLTGKTKLTKLFMLDVDYAISGLTKNTLNDGELTTNQINMLPFVYKMKQTSHFYHAYKSSLSMNLKLMKIALNYERIDPNYRTLGAYFFNNDIENITIAPSISLLKGKLNITLNSGFQRNNLDATKLSTTKRWVGSAGIAFVPNQKWSYNLNYSNFSSYTNVRPQTDPYYINSPADTLNFYQISQNANSSLNYNFGGKLMKHSLMINSNYQVIGEKNGSTTKQPNKIYNANLSYGLFLVKTKTSVNIGVNANQASFYNNKNLYFGPNLSVSKSLLNNTCKVNLGSTYNANLIENSTSNSIINTRSNFAYTPKLKNKNFGKPSFSLGIIYTNRFIGNTKISDELTGMMNITYSF